MSKRIRWESKKGGKGGEAEQEVRGTGPCRDFNEKVMCYAAMTIAWEKNRSPLGGRWERIAKEGRSRRGKGGRVSAKSLKTGKAVREGDRIFSGGGLYFL